MPPAAKALLAQLAGTLLAVLAIRLGLVQGGWTPLLIQPLGAAATAWLLRSAPWWLLIHLGFVPALFITHRLTRQFGLSPLWFLAAFGLLLLVYWSSFRTQVPLYLSNRRTALALAACLPPQPVHVADLGAGTGSLLRTLARLRPDCRFTGIELAPGPWLLGWLRCRQKSQIDWRRGDLFASSWAEFDVVYIFLSPVPMARAGRKAANEMKAGSLLVSNSFAIPDFSPSSVIEVGDRRRTRLLIYPLPLITTRSKRQK